MLICIGDVQERAAVIQCPRLISHSLEMVEEACCSGGAIGIHHVVCERSARAHSLSLSLSHKTLSPSSNNPNSNVGA